LLYHRFRQTLAKEPAVRIRIGDRDMNGANVTAKQVLIAKMIGATSRATHDSTQHHAQTK
jgi:hypothetical protein